MSAGLRSVSIWKSMGTSDNSMVEQISKKMGTTMQISISKTMGKSMVEQKVEDEANGITVLFSKEHLCGTLIPPSIHL